MKRSNFTTINVGDKVAKSIFFQLGEKNYSQSYCYYVMHMLLPAKTGNIIFIRNSILEDKTVVLS